MMWRPQRDSNPCFGLERATSWASGRWGHAGARVRCAGAVTGTPDHNRHTTNHQTCTRGEALTSWLCRDPPQDAEAHQLHENPRHPKDENEKPAPRVVLVRASATNVSLRRAP